jgi:hypothetical protein
VRSSRYTNSPAPLSRKRGRRPGFALTVLAFLLPLAALAASQITWKEQFYNPHPLPKDLILPMPCGGAMVFRPVVVPADRLLGDRRITLGGQDERFAFAEGFRQDFLAGSFAAPGAAAGAQGGRLYYIGKYEVTADQYAALGSQGGSGGCKPPTNLGRLPKTQVSWNEAVDFSVHYTEWLYAKAPAALPSEDKVRGFLRLPTEAEWEYAARGGAAVSDSEFIRPLFPMQGPLSDYAWFGSPDSSGFKPQAVGLLKPNPLGLYDILGNAAEMVLDPFRLNKISRLQGQAGGLIAKGGDYLTPPDAIRSAEREEINPFDAKGVKRSESIGFRLVIVGPVLTSPQRLAQIAQEWHDLPKSESALAGTQRLEDPLDEIDLLIKSTEDQALKERLTGLRTVIQANIATRNEQRDRAALSMLNFGTFLLTRIKDSQAMVEFRKKALVPLENAPTADPSRQLLQKSLTDAEATAALDIKYYRDILSQIVQEYPPKTIDDELIVMKREFNEQGHTHLLPYADLLQRNLAQFRQSGDLASPEILKGLR